MGHGTVVVDEPPKDKQMQVLGLRLRMAPLWGGREGVLRPLPSQVSYIGRPFGKLKAGIGVSGHPKTRTRAFQGSRGAGGFWPGKRNPFEAIVSKVLAEATLLECPGGLSATYAPAGLTGPASGFSYGNTSKIHPEV